MASEPQPERVLVTGAHGFTGRHVIAELEREYYAVHDLSHAQPESAAGRTARIDLLDAAAVAEAVAVIRPQAVIHLAAVAFVAHGDADAIYRTNIMGTRNLLAALAALPECPRKVILASSANVYGNAPEQQGEPLDECAPVQPANDYAVSKLSMEYMARLWANRLPLTLTRPFNYTGVGQDARFLVPKIVEHFRRGECCIELGNLDVWRPFSDVRAVAWVYRRLLETSCDGETFNICPGEVHSLRDLLSMMEDIAGYAIEVRVNPQFVRENEVKRLQGDDSKLERQIGAAPKYAMTDTLRWMYQT